MTELFGRWETDPTDHDGIAQYGKSTIYFGHDGRMAYVVHSSARDEVIRLTYEIDGDALITDQPSTPSVQRTHFEFTLDGRLVLSLFGRESRYVKVAG